jgi:uncharacterized protein (TIGR02147 family)
MIDIFSYFDYRTYLKDYFAESKKTCKAFSHQFFADKAGIKSTGFMLHVINGQRNLTVPVLLKVAKAINLDNPQTEYFETLVALNQAKNQSEKEYFLQKLLEKRRIAKTFRIEDRQIEFYSEWYHAAIRELVNVVGNNGDVSKMAKLLTPSVSPAKVRESLSLLLELGLIRETSDNHYEITHQYIEGDDPALRTAIIAFQRSMLTLAGKSWDNCPAGEVSAHTLTLALSEKLAEELKSDMEQFKKKSIEKILADKDTAQRVYQVNMNLFPLSKNKEGEAQ